MDLIDLKLAELGMNAFLGKYHGAPALSKLLVVLVDEANEVTILEARQEGSITHELIELPIGEEPLWE